MTLEEKKLLFDVKVSVEAIDEYLSGKRNFSYYQQNKIVRRAVERELSIIGEAINNLLKINPQTKISYARQIVNLRNKVTHAYDNIDDTVIWNIVVNHLPTLQKEVNELLAD